MRLRHASRTSIDATSSSGSDSSGIPLTRICFLPRLRATRRPSQARPPQRGAGARTDGVHLHDRNTAHAVEHLVERRRDCVRRARRPYSRRDRVRPRALLVVAGMVGLVTVAFSPARAAQDEPTESSPRPAHAERTSGIAAPLRRITLGRSSRGRRDLGARDRRPRLAQRRDPRRRLHPRKRVRRKPRNAAAGVASPAGRLGRLARPRPEPRRKRARESAERARRRPEPELPGGLARGREALGSVLPGDAPAFRAGVTGDRTPHPPYPAGDDDLVPPAPGPRACVGREHRRGPRLRAALGRALPGAPLAAGVGDALAEPPVRRRELLRRRASARAAPSHRRTPPRVRDPRARLVVRKTGSRRDSGRAKEQSAAACGRGRADFT